MKTKTKQQTFLTYEAASSSVYTSALMAPLRVRPLTTGFMGGDTSSSRESDLELDFCCKAICWASSCRATCSQNHTSDTQENRLSIKRFAHSTDIKGTCCHVSIHLFQSFKVVPEKRHGPVRPGCAQLDDAVLEQLLDVVFLDILLTLLEAPLLLGACTA